MRKYILNIRLAAVMAAPLLLACGSNSSSGGTTYVAVPDCGGAANQVLTTDATGQLQCQPLPAGALTLPDCTTPAGQALTSDGNQPSCDSLNTIDANTQTLLNTLTDIEKKIMDYGTMITAYQTAAGGPAVYVGLTATTTTGRIAYTDANNVKSLGIAAASNICAKEFGVRSHMCTAYELYYSAAKLKFSATTDINPGGWAYMQSGRYSTTSPLEADNGMADNCGGYTTETATNNWNGTEFVWKDAINRGIKVPHFYGNTPVCHR